MGATASTTALNAAALGVGVGVVAFCSYVDKADPESAAGRSFDAAYKAITTAIETAEKATAKCAASEICSTGKEIMTSAANVIFKTVSDVKKEAEEHCNASPACVSAKDEAKSLISSAVNTASFFGVVSKTVHLWWQHVMRLSWQKRRNKNMIEEMD